MTGIREVGGLAGLLSSVTDRPRSIWVQGSMPTAPSVAIVGTRTCTTYGRAVAEALGRAVAASGWTVVSGLARGIDAAAHRGTLQAGGVGYAVLGSGVDVIYPAENRQLARDLVAAGGGLLSEYSPGTPPTPYRFPARNRLIAGLAAAVVVVEAAVTGGALITARLALDQGKEVLAVPGDIDRPTSEGCNLLIRDGAHPVLSALDLVASLTVIMGPPPREPVEDPEHIAAASVDDVVTASDRPVGEVLAGLARAEIAAATRSAPYHPRSRPAPPRSG